MFLLQTYVVRKHLLQFLAKLTPPSPGTHKHKTSPKYSLLQSRTKLREINRLCSWHGRMWCHNFRWRTGACIALFLKEITKQKVCTSLFDSGWIYKLAILIICQKLKPIDHHQAIVTTFCHITKKVTGPKLIYAAQKTFWHFLFHVDRPSNYREISNKPSRKVCIVIVTITFRPGHILLCYKWWQYSKMWLILVSWQGPEAKRNIWHFLGIRFLTFIDVLFGDLFPLSENISSRK